MNILSAGRTAALLETHACTQLMVVTVLELKIRFSIAKMESVLHMYNQRYGRQHAEHARIFSQIRKQQQRE